ncbi:hypothetical protein LTR62_003192 [Meristemomyces frigidus]|uniref:Tat pathway signal sequence n=1 Tax=Meristemomyces frigidus TaxID=1508187 RepID=A0AAN7YKW1_9PEZI|nr:hypothetical protein LTR62_003192 [Meristemomyces frigidus]
MDYKGEGQPFISNDYDQETLPPRRPERFSPTILVALGISIVLNLVVVYRILSWSAAVDLDQRCGSYTEQYDSPLLDAIPVRYETVRYNGNLLKENIYRGPPSPEVDAAWDELGANFGTIIIPETGADRYGIDPGMVKRQPSRDGGFAVQAEGFHHLHCLNLLRQATWFNYEYYQELGDGPFSNEEPILRKHVGHCVDILRQQLMCTFDTSIFGQWWVKDHGNLVDFNTDHRCKNFGDYRDWYRERAAASKGSLVKFREGDILLPEIP